MAKFQIATFRLQAHTLDRLASLAESLGVPRTVLARRILEREVDRLWSLTEPTEDSE